VQSGNSALHRAAAYGRSHLLATLLHAGCPLNAVNNAGETSLARAARWGHASVVQSLLEAGADPSIPDTSGLRPMDWAARKGFDDIVQILTSFSPPPRPSRKSMRPTSVAIAAALGGGPSDDTGATTSAPGRTARPSVRVGAHTAMPRLAEEGGGEAATLQAAATRDAGGAPLSGYAADDDESHLRTFSNALEYEEEAGPATVEGWMYKQGHVSSCSRRRRSRLLGLACPLVALRTSPTSSVPLCCCSRRLSGTGSGGGLC
jgi:hypothetical protein